MERIEKTFEIDVPVRAAYNQWTQFEEFPHFMDGIKAVVQVDDTHLHWIASIAGKEEEWDSLIVEQIPDKIISWTSVSGAKSMGQVKFEPLDEDRTRLHLSMAYEPEGAIEKTGDALGVFSRKVEKTVEDFKSYIEKRGVETGGWRGSVTAGHVTGSSDSPPNTLG